MAEEKGLDITSIVGTGTDGAISADDVARAAAGGAAPVKAAVAAAPAKSGYVSDIKGLASPEARKMAASGGLDLNTMVGTGLGGRITFDDVKMALGKPTAADARNLRLPQPVAPTKAAAAPAAAAVAKPAAAAAQSGVTPMNGMQKAVVKNMEWSLSVPTFQVSRNIVTDKLDALYAELKPKGVTVSALMAKACAMALAQVPLVNARYVKDGIEFPASINVAVAVAMPDGGLITPTLQSADQTDIYQLSRTWADLVKRARSKELKPIEYSSGTFTISNLGMMGVDTFGAILPPNQGAILAIGASKPTVVALPSGMLGVVKRMSVTITCDHRHIYGADAAKFLESLANVLEGDINVLLK